MEDYVEDMCEDEAAELKKTMADHTYYDENTWLGAGPEAVEKGREGRI